MVEKVVYSIMTSNLVRDPAMHGSQDVMDLQELYDDLERFRLEVRFPRCASTFWTLCIHCMPA